LEVFEFKSRFEFNCLSVFKIETLFYLTLYPYPISGPFCFQAQSPKSVCAPSAFPASRFTTPLIPAQLCSPGRHTARLSFSSPRTAQQALPAQLTTRVCAPPLPFTNARGSHVSFFHPPPVKLATEPESRSGQSRTRRPCPAPPFPAGPLARARPRAIYCDRAAALPLRLNPSSRAASHRRRSDPSAPPPSFHSAVIHQPSWAASGISQGGEEENRVTRSRPRAPPRRFAIAGPTPLLLLAVHHRASPSPPRQLPVEFARVCSTSRCNPRSKRCAPAPYYGCAAARRRCADAPASPPTVPRRCPLARVHGRWIADQWPRTRQPPGQTGMHQSAATPRPH
jgi:hypothetical protein